MNTFSQDLRNKSVFQLLGTSETENQEDDLKLAELGTLRQLVLNLQTNGVSATESQPLSDDLSALESVSSEEFPTRLDAFYGKLSEKYGEQLESMLEKAVEDFKVDVLRERIRFLQESMQSYIDGIFSRANDLLKAEDLNQLLPYLDEVQTYLKSIEKSESEPTPADKPAELSL